jgi:hypothetical protein
MWTRVRACEARVVRAHALFGGPSGAEGRLARIVFSV